MECREYQEQFTSFLSGLLDETSGQELENHIGTCDACRAEFSAYQKVWGIMGEISEPEPSDKMRTGFDAILKNFKEEHVRKNQLPNWVHKLRNDWHFRIKPGFAFSVFMLLVGFGAGYFLNRPQHTTLSYNRQIDSLSSQVAEMKQMIMLSLLQNPSASQRIRGVSYTDEEGVVNNKVIDALLTTLNEDPNVNVRLVTLEALVKFSNDPKVRRGLVQSITLQDSPILQSAIADVMVKLQEKSSVKSLQELLQKKDLNELVKVKIEQSIHKLI